MVSMVLIKFGMYIVIGLGSFMIFMKKILPIMFYKVNVVIREKRGNALVWKKDRARRVIDKDGTEKYQLYHAKTSIEPPKFEHYQIDNKGKPILELFSPTSGVYKPIQFEEPEKMKTEDKEARFWYVQEHKKYRDKYYKASFMERYAPYISMILLATFGTIQLIIWARSTGTMSEHLAQASKAFASAAEGIKTSMAQIAAARPPI